MATMMVVAIFWDVRFYFVFLCKTILCFKRMDIMKLQGKTEKKYAEWNSIQLKQHLLHFSGFWVAIWVWTWNSWIVRSKTDTRCTLCFVHVLYHGFCYKLEKLWRWWFVAKPKIMGKENFATAILPSIHVLRRDFIFMHVLFHNLISTK